MSNVQFINYIHFTFTIPCEFARNPALLDSVTEHLTVARGTAVLGTVGRRNVCHQLLICKLRTPLFIYLFFVYLTVPLLTKMHTAKNDWTVVSSKLEVTWTFYDVIHVGMLSLYFSGGLWQTSMSGQKAKSGNIRIKTEALILDHVKLFYY
jgi:hypothetical protein